MVDFIKVDLPTLKGADIARNRALSFFTPTDHASGECRPWREASHRHLLLRIHDGGYTALEGSLHKFWDGQHNGGGFTALNLREAVQELTDILGVSASEMVLRTLEFGVNVPLSASASTLLRRAVLYKTGPLDVNTFSGKGLMREATAQRYYFKLYDKERALTAHGFASLGHSVRVELKATRMEHLRAAGITTVADLLNVELLSNLGELLVKAFGNVLFAAPAKPRTLTPAERHFLTVGANYNYWEDLHKEHPASFGKKRRYYRDLVAKHAPDVLANEAAAGIEQQLKHLLLSGRPVPELTSLPAHNGGDEHPAINTLNTVLDTAPKRRTCQSCGRDISHQAEQSKFCSQRRYGAEGKRCRNAASNKRHNAVRAVRRLIVAPQLFALDEVLVLDKDLKDFVLGKLRVT